MPSWIQPDSKAIPLDKPMLSYKNQANIDRSTADLEYHPLHPFLPEGCSVLFLGSFPPARKRWAKGFDFFYPNYINDHWRIEGAIFFGDKLHFVDEANKTFRLPEIIDFLKDKGIGFFDTATAVRRLKDNASDKFLEIVEPTDIPALLRQIPQCRVIVTTGEKATRTICETLSLSEVPGVGQYVKIPQSSAITTDIYLYRLPSSSRAYPLSLDKKVNAYRQMFVFAGMID